MSSNLEEEKNIHLHKLIASVNKALAPGGLSLWMCLLHFLFTGFHISIWNQLLAAAIKAASPSLALTEAVQRALKNISRKTCFSETVQRQVALAKRVGGRGSGSIGLLGGSQHNENGGKINKRWRRWQGNTLAAGCFLSFKTSKKNKRNEKLTKWAWTHCYSVRLTVEERKRLVQLTCEWREMIRQLGVSTPAWTCWWWGDGYGRLAPCRAMNHIWPFTQAYYYTW